MIYSYIKTCFRTLLRHKLFTMINIIGLSVSMAVGLLVIAFVFDLASYDDFHENNDKIYRVFTTFQQKGQKPVNYASASIAAGRKIRETVSGIDHVSILRPGFGGNISAGEKTVPLNGLFADESFFNIFTFPLVQGDPATALKQPYTLVLTEKTSKKLFGSAKALGRSVKVGSDNYVVTGVMKDIPKLSHLRFEALASFASAEKSQDLDFLSWGSIYQNYVYISVAEKSDLRTIQSSLNGISRAGNLTMDAGKISLGVQQLKQIVFNSSGISVTNELGPVMNTLAIWVLIGLAMLVMLSACFNYTNLSIARSLRRTREVGVRKMSGALTRHVIAQFLVESVIISLLSLTFAFLLFLLLRREFLALDFSIENMVSLKLSPIVSLGFVSLGIFVGILAGITPAIFFSRIDLATVLKTSSSLRLFRHVNPRKALIVSQYTLSIIFIATTIIGYGQYRNFVDFDLGFNTKNKLNIKLQGNNADLLIKELSELPQVSSLSQSMLVMGLGNIYTGQVKHKSSGDSAMVWMNFIDSQYLKMHGHTLLAGRDFVPRSDQAEESEIIVTRQLLQKFDMDEKDPGKALGEVLDIEGKNLAIIGVIKDFHYETVEDQVEPVILRNITRNGGGYLTARILTEDWPETLESIKNAWQKVDKTHPLEATLYDDQIEKAYSPFSMMIKIIGFLAFLTVCIASLGLFGMVVFTTETRLKEISIRKVLGASESSLILLLSRNFLVMLLLAALIALPATYFFFDKIVLVNFAYHKAVSVAELLISLSLVVVLAFAMIGSQTFKTARTNPSKVLKAD